MTREQGQFDEGFAAEVVRKEAAESNPPAPPGNSYAPLTAEQLGAMLCRLKAIRIGTGEEILVMLSAADWQALMDAHDLEIFKKKGGTPV